MAITIVTTPEEHTPAYNNQFYVVSGTNTAQTNFKYVCTVYVDGESTELKYPPDPTTSHLYFNPQRIVESYVSSDYNFDIDQIEKATNAVKKVIVAFDEEYGSPVSGFTGTSGDYYVWNAAYNAHDFSSYTYTAGTEIKALSLAPVDPNYASYGHDKINFNQKYLLKSFYVPFGDAVVGGLMAYQLRVIAYDVNGNALQDTYIYNIYYGSASIPERYFITFNASPYGLNLIKTNNPSHILSQTDPTDDVIPAATASYTFAWYNSSPNLNSLNYSIEINEWCSKYDRYVLHFLNRLGNFDSYTFNLLSTDTSKKETKEYRSTPYYLNASNKYTYSNSISDRNNYNTIITNSIKLNSDWVSDDVYAWLKDLFMSPKVYIEDSSGNLYSATVKDKDWTKRKSVNDKVFNITIELEYNYQDIRQRG